MSYLNELIKNIFINSSLIANPSNIEYTAIDQKKNDFENSLFVKENFEKKLLHEEIPQLILARSINNLNMYGISHKSHSSHRSHSSHQSHLSSSSGTYTPLVTPKRVIETPSETKTIDLPSNENPFLIESKVKTESIFGKRTLKKGMKGKDVVELKNILKDKFKYNMKNVDYINEDLFDDYLEIMIKDFQKKKDIKIDGIVDVLTIFYLNN